jgi:hypothetical protein
MSTNISGQVLRDRAIAAGRAARERQGLPAKLDDPVLISRLAVIWREGGVARDDE